MTNEFHIEDTPTLVFIRNGTMISRIDKLNESNPNKIDNAGIEAESEDEKRVKQKLQELCKKHG